MSERKTVPAAGAWGPIIGYSRAVRAGQSVNVAGTTAPGADLAEQTRAAFGVALDAAAELGATPADVVRTRMFLTDISQWEAAGRVHGELFGDSKPVTTMVEVSALIDSELLIEVELEAYVPEGR
ncbi:MAG: Rid family hydrolase [Solirubrobacteraceae bacterium]|nr:Rid family hydrolase [Solirubrobacteraceae bacterium]